MNLLEFMLMGGGLTTLSNDIITKWIGPVFFVAIAVYALILLKDRQFRQAIVFAGIAIIVGLFVFFGQELFGKSGSLTRVGKGISDKIQSAGMMFEIAKSYIGTWL